jgi:response regulator NasT
MGCSYRIAIVSSESTTRAELRRILVRLGHNEIVEASTVEGAVAQRSHNADGGIQLIIVDVKLRDISCILDAERILECRGIPFIVVSDEDDGDSVERASTHQAFAYLTKPVRETDLKAGIQIAVERFAQLRTYRADVQNIKQALEDRKIIERAKGVLMRTQSLDEAGAFTLLQRIARERRQKLIEVARGILIAEDAFQGLRD